MGVKRIFVEKKASFSAEAGHLQQDLQESLNLKALSKLRILNRYDIEDLSDEAYAAARHTIFSEPPVDHVYDETFPHDENAHVFAIELLPGQYDQRADSAAQCLQLLTQKKRPELTCARIYVIEGDLTPDDLESIKHYLINPVESREASLEKPETLRMTLTPPQPVPVLNGFTELDSDGLDSFQKNHGLAMSTPDLAFCQQYFRDTEKRNPTVTEIRMIDTYWSDHCRHTTFLTEITDVTFDPGFLNEPAVDAWHLYQHARTEVYGERQEEKPVCLMDLAVIAMKEMRLNGKLDDLEVSEEINACSIIVPAVIDGRTEEWLVMFKNETHNHPTEIEPFGGAATCLGGAIRDPLSGRSYVYQAMRITGSGDPRAPLADTLPGKLPQRKITQEAAKGYSSYGNQIGLSTGYIKEFYHERFIAKRMELGAVIGAAPRSQVTRKSAEPGDVILLVGGRTGRDGCGGATGSSKEHDETSLFSCGAEVQKGNAPTERKIQRLFRNPQVSRLIKKCNDFGAGGVSVAIGELADGLTIDLDRVPKKYEGLDGTELAISESQERMAVVLDPSDETAFIKAADLENLEAVRVATVTDDPRLIMHWQDQTVVDISRSFLDTNGVKQQTTMVLEAPDPAQSPFNHVPESLKPAFDGQARDIAGIWHENLKDLNVCSQKGLIEKFDSTVGAGSSLMPLGGLHQLTPTEGMAARLPVLEGNTNTVTGMTAGYQPEIGCWSPFHGAYYAVIESLSRLAAMGFPTSKARLSLQEYFEKPGNNPSRWGKPLAALLGAYTVQKAFETPAIGGKDSMSGTFKDMDVPPTLVSFAVAAGDEDHLCSPEFKQAGRPVLWVKPGRDERHLLDHDLMQQIFSEIQQGIAAGTITAVKTVGLGGAAAALSQMCFGNQLGMMFDNPPVQPFESLFYPEYGSFLLEVRDEATSDQLSGILPVIRLGQTTVDPVIRIGEVNLSLSELLQSWKSTLEPIFPTETGAPAVPVPDSKPVYGSAPVKRITSIPRPRVVIPVFPGTNCEYDSARAFERAGAVAELLVLRNLTPAAIEESVTALADAIRNAQMIMLPGGFSAGDEPDGSGKFITVVFRNPRIQEAVNDLLQQRDGLILGVCNGFQALIKLGLVPYGEIRDPHPDAPTLTFNTIGRHVSGLARTRIASTISPWFASLKPGDLHTVPVSHGEGRFVAKESDVAEWLKDGRVAAQYVDLNGTPSMNIADNPNGSFAAVEALSSADGRILGKMTHSERRAPQLYRNVPGEKDQKIFESGVAYYR
jgi:phosphoribosylformylglycinamidine synthase